MATILLVRHAESTWNRDGRIQGWAPTRLTERGREQAKLLGEELATTYNVTEIRGSDLLRTRETTERIRHNIDVPVTFNSAWRERNFGIYQGFSYEGFFEKFPEFSVMDSGYIAISVTPDGGESIQAMRNRVLDAWHRLCAEVSESETVVVITHGGPLYALFGELTGTDLVTSFIAVDLKNCGINEVRIEESVPELIDFADARSSQ